ncbi:ABC transporter B family member 1-like isoform X1 [Apium graveolens]|uniref:ABC transporter B family member 1-like isoform X1 n=1 Tax=Apium graveolens TaxID=4045 RepID=UPI003D7BD485
MFNFSIMKLGLQMLCLGLTLMLLWSKMPLVKRFVVGFTVVWQLSLVTLAIVPLIAEIGVIHQSTLFKLSSKTQEALSQTGNIAEQTVGQIRMVFAFVSESRAPKAYSLPVRTAQRLGYKSGFSKGLGLGATYFTVFCCYALLLWIPLARCGKKENALLPWRYAERRIKSPFYCTLLLLCSPSLVSSRLCSTFSWFYYCIGLEYLA